MAVSSAFPRVITNLVTLLRAALPNTTVFDGIEPTSDDTSQFIVVGANDPEDPETVAGQTSNEYAQLGARSMFENGTVNCVLVAQSGDTDIAEQRANAYTLLSAVDTAIRQNVTLSGACLFAGLGETTATYMQTTRGVAVEIAFTINYRAKTNL